MNYGLLNSAKLIGKDAIAALLARGIPRSIAFDKRYFPLWEKRGFHITSNHFYEPVPSSDSLARHDFYAAGDLRGIDFRDAAQRALLAEFQQRYSSEYNLFSEMGDRSSPEFFLRNGSFEEVDAEILYCMMRHRKPKRVIEIGSGFSSRLIGKALAVNEAEGSPCSQFAIVDPFLDSRLINTIPCVSALVGQPVQNLAPSFFDSLGNGDVLFIDSSHVLKTGSDVQFEFLTVLPRLNPGVLVHIHDVFLPADYPSEWLLSNRWFWSEQYLLQAFLQFNERFQVLWAGNYMHLRHPAELGSAFPSYTAARSLGTRHWPASFWMARIL